MSEKAELSPSFIPQKSPSFFFKKSKLFASIFFLTAFSLSSFPSIASCASEFITIIREPSAKESAKAKVRVHEFHTAIRKFSLENSKEVKLIKYGNVADFELLRLDINTASNARAPRILITGGIHGNETLGALASFEFVKRFMSKPELKKKFNLVVIPATNPKALFLGSRRYAEGVDLNRLFVPSDKTPEALALKSTLEDQNFAMLLDLHGGSPPAAQGGRRHRSDPVHRRFGGRPQARRADSGQPRGGG